MQRRDFLRTTAGLFAGGALLNANAAESLNFQYNLLNVGPEWESRGHALVKLAYEVQKRCNIPIESDYRRTNLSDVADVGSPFFIINGSGVLPTPSVEDARLMRLVLGSGGLLLFDDASPADDTRFYDSAKVFMSKVFPEIATPGLIPSDHAVYQSYYLLKEPRGRLNKREYMEGWTPGHRTCAFFSHNDLLGAMEADRMGAWRYNMEIGGGFRRELCFRLCINMTYYALTLNYKKDRAFPPIIERRRRL